MDIHGLGVRLDISSSTSVFLASMTQPMGLRSTGHYAVATNQHRNTKTGILRVIHSQQTYTTSETWFGKSSSRFVPFTFGTILLSFMDQKYDGLEFIEPLIADMVLENPTKRPTMDEVVTRFAEIKRKLSTWKLRSRMARKNEVWPLAAWRAINHWRRTVGYVLTRKTALPEPK
jgi:hypothetical protein